MPEQLLHQFAAVNAAAEQIQLRYASDFANARDNPQKVQQLYAKMNKEIMAALADSGISMDQYKQVVDAAAQDPGLRARIVKLVAQIRAGMKQKE